MLRKENPFYFYSKMVKLTINRKGGISPCERNVSPENLQDNTAVLPCLTHSCMNYEDFLMQREDRSDSKHVKILETQVAIHILMSKTSKNILHIFLNCTRVFDGSD